MEIPHIYKICFISQSGYLLFRSCPGFSGDLITKSCTLWQNILKTERQISGMISSPSAPPPSYNQVELWSRLKSSPSTPPPQQVLKDISFSKLPLTLSDVPADLYIWAPSAWTCPAQVRRCCFKKSWGVTQPKRRKPVCPACPVWRAPTERFCCVQQIFHYRQYHFLCGYFHWASTCKCRKRRLG